MNPSFGQSLHTLGQKFRGKGGEAVVRDVHERVQRRRSRPRRKTWEKVAISLIGAGGLVYLLVDKLA